MCTCIGNVTRVFAAKNVLSLYAPELASRLQSSCGSKPAYEPLRGTTLGAQNSSLLAFVIVIKGLQK